jgi:uncharacterized protein (DUF58 family)
MDTKEILKKVRAIEIKTRRLSDHIFSGEYHSSFKGRGMSFSEVREYTPGDDVRGIDWNVTARFNAPYVKVFEEERELTMVLMVDVSASEVFGTRVQRKNQMITEICAVLAFSAIKNNDKVGVLFFSDKIEKFIPPKKGKNHILRIIRELIDFRAESKGTNIELALGYLANMLKKKSIAFLISDFMDKDYQNAMSLVGKKHDLTTIKVNDIHDKTLPDMGLVKLWDPETEKETWVNTSSKNMQKVYSDQYFNNEKYYDWSCKKSGSGKIEVTTEDSYVKKLLAYFKKR